MKLHSPWLITLVLTAACIAGAQVRAPYLSDLKATRSSPLYTTYAAPMERSEFTLDKGYHFVFYDSTRGADFANETGGDLCLAFTKGGKYVYALKDMYEQPVITASYPDMVLYTFRPFEDIRVNVTFLVYSSHHALQAIDVQNMSSTRARVEVIPFLKNNSRTFENVEFRKEVSALAFTHEEFPDDWVLEHKIPFVNKVQDSYLFSDAPARMMSFRSYSRGTVDIPQVNDLQKQPVYLVWGRIGTKDGGRCSGRPETSRLMALLNGDRRRILTEAAPRWGSAEKNVTRYGYYGIELGNLGPIKEGDRFSIYGSCDEPGLIASVTGTARKTYDGDSARYDMVLERSTGPAAPEGVRMDIWKSGAEVRLSWKKSHDAVEYNVYRRDYHAGGIYELIGENVGQVFFTDKNIPPDQVYGYVVVALDAKGAMSMHSREVNNIAGSDFLTDVSSPGQAVSNVKDLVRIVAASQIYDIPPGLTHRLVVVRSVGRGDTGHLIDSARGLITLNLRRQLERNEKLFSSIPALTGVDSARQMLYWSAFSLMRQVMMPPEARCHFNYYVFSREPQWGWGHGGQVFHESLTMLSYALMDATSTMNSQRVYMERQHPDGYINYRTGPYLDEDIPYAGQLTTSAPWYAWQNWEIYKISHDKKFLEDAYASSGSFYRYYVKNRDSDGDGLCEWGAHAVLECVRDGMVAVWDEVGWPSNFEAVDLNTMLVVEAKSLASMAKELGRASEAAEWERDAENRAAKINATMWDEATGFYYNVDKKSHSFTFAKADDLKREEIIGFLPLWAGIASKEQARRLIAKLTDPSKFWRKFGVPTLAADDHYYNPKGYWNGPVWVQWDYLIVRGLLQYGYVKEARELTDRVVASVIAQLRKDHDFWEFYSPDDQWAGYHKTYIWAGIVNRMLLDVEQSERK